MRKINQDTFKNLYLTIPLKTDKQTKPNTYDSSSKSSRIKTCSGFFFSNYFCLEFFIMKALVTLKYNKLQFGSCCSYWSRINYNSKEFPGSLRTGYYLIIFFRDSENLFLKQAFCFHPCLFNRKTFSVSYFSWWLEYFLNFQPKFINRCFILIFIFLALNLSLMINFAFLKCFCLFTLNCLCSYLRLPFTSV